MARPPVIIIIWCALRVFGLLRDGVQFVNGQLGAHFGVGQWLILGLSVAVAAVGGVGLWTMRKWGLVLLVLHDLANFGAMTLRGFDWWGHYPHVGPFAYLFWIALLAGTCLIYWKRMVWRVISPPDVSMAEVFK